MPRSRLLALLLTLLLPLVLGAGDARDLGPASFQQMQSEKRVALVIGNGAYGSGALRNPPSDARAVAARLQALGFEVTLRTDLDQNGMKKAIIDFGRALDAGGVGLFFYAGHGIQHEGRNYLVPIGADIADEAYIDVLAVDVNLVLAGMEAARNRLNIVILDACRNNPFESRFRSQGRGLAQLSAPTGTFIAYATGPGDVAEDGSGANSSFTAALVQHLDARGVELEKVFKAVRQDVYQATGGSQTPWTNNSVMGDFYFALPDTGDSGWEAPAEPEVSVLEPDPGTVVVTVKNGGEVKLDGVSKGRVKAYGGLELKGVSAGRHRVGVGSEEQVVEVTPGGTVRVELVGEVATTPAPAPAPAATTSAGGGGIDWVSIPGKSYQVSRSEVTVRQYEACVDSGACSAPYTGDSCTWGVSGREDHPVNCVDWDQASAYARWAGGRLPSESEWEYAASGGQDHEYAGSDDVDEVAWYDGNSGGRTHPVCQKQRNGYGLCDMSGNVWEWTSTAEGSRRVLRGGSWSRAAASVRVADRCRRAPSGRYGFVGFRLAR